jgi:hypothetical protein
MMGATTKQTKRCCAVLWTAMDVRLLGVSLLFLLLSIYLYVTAPDDSLPLSHRSRPLSARGDVVISGGGSGGGGGSSVLPDSHPKVDVDAADEAALANCPMGAIVLEKRRQQRQRLEEEQRILNEELDHAERESDREPHPQHGEQTAVHQPS